MSDRQVFFTRAGVQQFLGSHCIAGTIREARVGEAPGAVPVFIRLPWWLFFFPSRLRGRADRIFQQLEEKRPANIRVVLFATVWPIRWNVQVYQCLPSELH